MARRVIAPLVITKNQDGTDLYLYEGALVPPLSAGEVKRLEVGGFISADDKSADDKSADAGK